jgi:hypothetical protein
VMTPLNILETARANLGVSSDRWHKGGYVGDKTDCLCAAGHLRLAAGGEVEEEVVTFPDDFDAFRSYFDAGDRLCEAVVTLHGQNATIPDFNDHPDTQYLDVLNAFDLAIAMEKQQ